MKVHTIVLFDRVAFRSEWSELQREKGRRGSVVDARFLRADDVYDIGVLIAPADDANAVTKLRELESCQEYDTRHCADDVPEAILNELRYLKAKGHCDARARRWG